MIVTNLALVYSESCNDPWMQLNLIVMKADVLLLDLNLECVLELKYLIYKSAEAVNIDC